MIIISCSLPNCDLDRRVWWSDLTLTNLDLSLFTWFFDCNFEKNYRAFQRALYILHSHYQRVLHSGDPRWQCTLSVYCPRWSWFSVIFGGHLLKAYRFVSWLSACLSALFHLTKKIITKLHSLFSFALLQKAKFWACAFEIEKFIFNDRLKKGLRVTFCLLIVWSVFLHLH